MNAFAKSAYQPPTPELCADFAIKLPASFPSICVHSRWLHSLELCVLSVCSWLNSLILHFAAEFSNLQTRNFKTHSGLETPLRKTETSHPELRHLAPLSTSYANFSVRKTTPSKTETGVRFRASKLSNPGLAHSLANWLLEIGPCSPSLRNDPETIPETFQAVSRNAETLALQMNHLREFDLEMIKKIFLKRFRWNY